MTDTAFSGGAPAASSDDRNLALVSYALLCAAPFVFGLTALIAVVIAYVRKPEAEPVTASHYRYQIRSFWIGFALSMIAALALMVGVGFLMVDLVKALVMNAPADLNAFYFASRALTAKDEYSVQYLKYARGLKAAA